MDTLQEFKNHGEKIIEYNIPIELDNSNNGQGHSWHKSANRSKKYKDLLSLLSWERRGLWPLKGVYNHVVRVIPKRGRKWDSSSQGRGNWKQIEDALVKIGMFEDDDCNNIINTFFFQEDEERPKKAYIKLIIYKKI